METEFAAEVTLVCLDMILTIYGGAQRLAVSPVGIAAARVTSGVVVLNPYPFAVVILPVEGVAVFVVAAISAAENAATSASVGKQR